MMQTAPGKIRPTRKEIVEAVVALFWHRGAEIASYSDIVAATGLSRKALYGYWPDKEALIAETLEVYHESLVSMVDSALAEGGVRGLEAFWDGVENAARSEGWRGCYLSRTACGPLRAHPKVSALYQDYFDHFTARIARAVGEGQACGDIDERIDAATAGLQSFSLLGVISALGAQAGYGDRIAQLFRAGRASCGVGKA